MIMYICIANFSSNYFGLGVTEEAAYNDLVRKWDLHDVTNTSYFNQCTILQVLGDIPCAV